MNATNKVLPDDVFRVACVVISQAAAPVYPASGRGAKLAHCGAISDCTTAELTYLRLQIITTE